MPEVQRCWQCKKAVDPKTDKYVIVAKAKDDAPERLAHAACAKKNRGPRHRQQFDQGGEA